MSASTCRSSGRKTSSAALTGTGSALLAGVCVETDGTNAATVTVYDNTAASGTILYKQIVPGAAGGRCDIFNRPVKAENGLYVAISGTGAAAIVYMG